MNIPLNIFEELRFLFELRAAIYPAFFFCYAKRKHFWFRFLPLSLALAGRSISYPFFFNAIKNSVSSLFIMCFSGFWYFFLTARILLQSLFSFERRVSDGLLFAIGGYTIQHLDRVLANEIVRFVAWPEITGHLLIYFLVCLATTLFFYVPYFYFLFRRNKKRRSILNDSPSTILLLLLLVVFLYTTTYLFQHFFRTTDSKDVRISAASGDCFSSFTRLIAIFVIQKASIEENEKEFRTLRYEKEKSEYEALKGNIEYINAKLHDLKYEIRRRKDTGSISEETYSEIQKSIKAYSGHLSTGNEILDRVLSDVTFKCQSYQIRFSPLADGTLLNGFDKKELYIVLSNIFDNAITYVKALPIENRFISFSVKKIHSFLVIAEENYFSKESPISFNSDGSIKTTKQEKKSHGFGTKSILLFANKHKGNAVFSVKDNRFSLRITIPL